eukprot:SAG31_NODE_6713_length_1915_cov_9.436123_1_plen_81_part_00
MVEQLNLNSLPVYIQLLHTSWCFEVEKKLPKESKFKFSYRCPSVETMRQLYWLHKSKSKFNLNYGKYVPVRSTVWNLNLY